MNGLKLQHCLTREELKEDWGVDMGKGPFRMLRAKLDEYTSSGVPTALLDEEAAKAEATRQREERERVRMFKFVRFAPV